MPIHSRQNQYFGVNAHLQSHFQTHGGWSSFHTRHIGDLAGAIDGLLPAGYLVDIEQSLQIREYHPDTGERLRRPEPDITIYDTGPERSRSASSSGSQDVVATLTQPVTATFKFDEDLYFSALVIRQIEPDQALGQPVTRIELLSPANKQGGSGEWQYLEKRVAAIKSGVCLVEMDYLHHTPSPVGGVPSYPGHDPGAYPYTITVSDPHPTLEDGLSRTFGFRIDASIPLIDIPLVGSDRFTLDFGAVYNQTFGALAAYQARVDYEKPPEDMDTYSSDDQERIWRRMEIVQTIYQRGINLDSGPFTYEQAFPG